MSIAYLLFGVLPYPVLLVFVAGILYRFFLWARTKRLSGLYNSNVGFYEDSATAVTKDVLKRVLLFYTLGDKERDKKLYVGSMFFHWGIWVVLFGHLGVLLPESYLSTMGVTSQLHHFLALYVGGAGGVVALLGLLLLMDRRVQGVETNVRLVNNYKVRVPLRKLSFLDDYFAVFILLAVIATGLYQTLVITPGDPAYINGVASWIGSLVSLHPNVSFISSLPAFEVHMSIVMLFLAYFPWGKMMHPLSYLLMPTISRRSEKVSL